MIRIQNTYIFLFLAITLSLMAFRGMKKSKTLTSKEIFSAYADMSKLEVELEVKAYLLEKGEKGEKGSKKQMLSYQMEYKSDHSQRGLYYTMGEEAMLRNEKWALQINHKDKTILYYQRDPQKATPQTLSEEEKTEFTQNLKQYMQNETMRFTFLRNEKNLKVYQTTGMPFPIKKTTFWLNEKKHIVKTAYDYHPNEYDQTNYVEVSYKTFNPSPSFDKYTFSEKKYIRAKGKNIVPSKDFEGYQVIDAGEYLQQKN